MKSKRVLVAMSGGIDSTATALLLQDQGYDIIGITLQILKSDSKNCEEQQNIDDVVDSAKSLAARLGIEHYVLDVSKKFKDIVIDNFINEYLKGRTPNQCAICNPTIKWGEILKLLKKYNCDYMATGHYARIVNEANRYYIKRAKDISKDQSYILWQLSQDQLSKTLFPLGEMNKTEVRKYVASKGFVSDSKKKDSQGICFSQNNDYRIFLKRNIKNIDLFVKPGNFYNSKKEFIGKHKGYLYYTIGQRKGLGITASKALYVIDIHKESNSVILGERDEIRSYSLKMEDVVCQKYNSIPLESKFLCKIRYSQTPEECTILKKDKTYYVKFNQGVDSITPGQSVVLYENEGIIAGGNITLN